MCGYRAILSQCDESCNGDNLSSGPGATLLETMEKILTLRLLIARSRWIEQGKKSDGNDFKTFLLEEMRKLGRDGTGKAGESFHGMLEVDDIRFISAGLGKRIVVVGASAGEVHDFTKEGKCVCYSENDISGGVGETEVDGIEYRKGE